jgi:hypothetical protein
VTKSLVALERPPRRHTCREGTGGNAHPTRKVYYWLQARLIRVTPEFAETLASLILESFLQFEIRQAK